MYIVGGRVLTMAGEEYAEGVLRLVNGKIAEIGSVGEVRVCPKQGEDVLNVPGAWVMPGLIEAHCHMGITEEKKGMEGDDCN